MRDILMPCIPSVLLFELTFAISNAIPIDLLAILAMRTYARLNIYEFIVSAHLNKLYMIEPGIHFYCVRTLDGQL